MGETAAEVNDCDTAHPAGDRTSLIEQLDVVDVADLRTFHRNPRKGSVPAIRRSLEINRQYKPIVACRGTYTGRPGEVLAGNHTLLAARDLGWRTLVVVWVDVDDDQAARINLADNRVAELGEGYDDQLLLELLGSLPDLDGTGYDPGDFDVLEALYRSDTELADDDLDDLADDLGDGAEDDLWPVVRLKVPPHVFAAWKAHVEDHAGREVAAFSALLLALDTGPDASPDDGGDEPG